MSMPQFPDLPGMNMENSIAHVVSSVAMEELALSHIINAEGEKLQYVLGTLHDTPMCPPATIEEVLQVNESVKDMLSTLTMNQMFLFAKFSAAMEAYKKGGANGGGGGDEGDECDEGGGEDRTGLEVVPGRILPAETAGDEVDWIEIAQYGKYSLIIRTSYLNIYVGAGQENKPSFQNTAFGKNNAYVGSQVQAKLNDWFNNTTMGYAEALAMDALLRDYTMRNTALDALGSGPVPAGFTDGFSKPEEEKAPFGLDVAFALSFGEAANYISNTYAYTGFAGPSSAIAQGNFAQITMPDGSKAYELMWLRSPGSTAETVSTLHYTGHAFQTYWDERDGERGLVYPALWVDSEIFDKITPGGTIVPDDPGTGGSGGRNRPSGGGHRH